MHALDKIPIKDLEDFAVALESIYRPVKMSHPNDLPTSQAEATAIAFSMGQASVAASIREHIRARIERATRNKE